MISKEEQHQTLAKSSTADDRNLHGTAFVVETGQPRMTCIHCLKSGASNCFQLIGFPELWPSNRAKTTGELGVSIILQPPVEDKATHREVDALAEDEGKADELLRRILAALTPIGHTPLPADKTTLNQVKEKLPRIVQFFMVFRDSPGQVEFSDFIE